MQSEKKWMKKKLNNSEYSSRVGLLVQCNFLGDKDREFMKFVEQIPNRHWSRYDLSAVRFGWEAYKVLHPNTNGNK